jgi:Fic family protein
MIYQIPKLEPIDQDVLGFIRGQRIQLQNLLAQTPIRWTGSLQKNTFARAVQGSNSIEGYNANLADAVEIIDDEKPESAEEETTKAIIGYRNALTYILQIHNDPDSEINQQLIRSLHFMMISYDMTKSPGQWRRGPIRVEQEATGETVYEAPDPETVPALMEALVKQMAANENIDAMVKAALAHLNLTMIHPFRDGNGRMARALQTLLLTKDGAMSPVFSSIEEWLGRNTQDYYNILAETGKGKWSPQNSSLNWVRFCLNAHYQQSATLIRRNNQIGRIWDRTSRILKSVGLPERAETAVIDAALGYRVRNSRYRTDAGVSEVVASRDLKQLCEAGLLLPVGEKRGRHYVAADSLKAIRDEVKDNKRSGNVYDAVRAKNLLPDDRQLDLPGVD